MTRARGAVGRGRRLPRTLSAAGLLVAALAALLVAWFVSGWADVRAQQREARAEPERAARRAGAALADDLRGELTRLIGREVERPYFHYRNLFHDPRSGQVTAVAPSPLAGGSSDPLVLGYFELDAAGRASTPPLNDELPELSESRRLADHRRFRDEVRRSLAERLAPGKPSSTLAAASQTQDSGPPPQQAASQVIKLDPSSYLQNYQPNEVFQSQNRLPAGVDPRGAPRAAASAPVTITVSPLEWRTLPFAGAPTLVAVRRVDTPDGALAQGFVIDRRQLASLVAARAGDAVAALRSSEDRDGKARAQPALRSGDAGAPSEIAPGWYVAVAAAPAALAAAAGEASAVARGFVVRFVAVGMIAVLAAGFVVVLVARAERLARERSQFAAAAAHELRTPLAGLQLYGDMIADGLGDPDKLRDYARRMSEEASRLGRVVSNVLGFSQLERGNLSVEPRAGELGRALCELAERAQPALDRAGAALAFDVAPGLRARFDRDALARVVGNLLDNAEKYSRGAADRTIGLAARETTGGVEVTVSDRGPGVTAQARAKLFHPFVRGVTGDGPAGLGLGLALSQSLARAMGGELDHRPGPGAGATFVLRLAKAEPDGGAER